MGRASRTRDIAKKQMYLRYAETELQGLQETHTQWILRSPNLYLPCHQFIQKTYTLLERVYEEGLLFSHDSEAAFYYTDITLTQYRDSKFPLFNLFNPFPPR